MIHHIERHIGRMREKPHHVKKQYAFLVSSLITLVIFLLWMLSYGIRSKAMADGVTPPTPLSSMTAGVGDAWGHLKALFLGANKMNYVEEENNVEVTGGGN